MTIHIPWYIRQLLELWPRPAGREPLLWVGVIWWEGDPRL